MGVRNLVGAVSGACLLLACAQGPVLEGVIPQFRVDPDWPKPFAEDNGVQLILGQVAGIAVGRNGHVWLIHRPSSLLADEWDSKASQPVTHRCCRSLPPVVELDADGRLVRAWGGPGFGGEWPAGEHGIYVDPDGNVWIAGNSAEDNQILKFSPTGEFMLQIGRKGKSEGSNSRTQLGRPAHMVLDPIANELYVADGYGNRRVVVFDAASGAYKRHWGAYGKKPDDSYFSTAGERLPGPFSGTVPVSYTHLTLPTILRV